MYKRCAQKSPTHCIFIQFLFYSSYIYPFSKNKPCLSFRKCNIVYSVFFSSKQHIQEITPCQLTEPFLILFLELHILYYENARLLQLISSVWLCRLFPIFHCYNDASVNILCIFVFILSEVYLQDKLLSKRILSSF